MKHFILLDIEHLGISEKNVTNQTIFFLYNIIFVNTHNFAHVMAE